MNIIESFNTKKIKNDNLAKEFQNIIKTITLSNSKFVMEKQLKNYINYLSTKSGNSFKVNVFEDELFQDKEGRYLAKNNQLIETDLKNNTINANLKLFEINSVEEFVNSAKLFAEATERLKINELKNNFSISKNNELYNDYFMHIDDINAISKFVNENTVFDMADKNLFKLRTNAIKFLDKKESMVRQFGINAQFEIFEALDQMNVLQKIFDDDLENLKFQINKKECKEFNTYLNIINETHEDCGLLVEKIKNAAIVQNKPKIVLRLAELMDMSEFYSKKCLSELKKFAKQNNNQKLMSTVEKSKENLNNKPKILSYKIPNYFKDELHFQNNVSQQTPKIEVTITEPYKDERIKIDVKNKRPLKIEKNEDDFVLEKRTKEKTADGNELEISVYGRTKEKDKIWGLSSDASRYVKNIWEDREK